MRIAGTVALVTGAGRGIGRALARALVQAGAAKVYAAARNPVDVGGLVATHPGVVEAVQLDVTDADAIRAAAAHCRDVGLLVNNAGVNRKAGLLAAPDLDAARAEMEINYFGTLRMCRGFAPVLAANGGGVIVNMAAAFGRGGLPLAGSYAAAEAALLALTQGVRAELTGQGTRVVAVLAGAVDTAMGQGLPPPRADPVEVAAAVLAGIAAGDNEICPGEAAQAPGRGRARDLQAAVRRFARFLPR